MYICTARNEHGSDRAQIETEAQEAVDEMTIVPKAVLRNNKLTVKWTLHGILCSNPQVHIVAVLG